MRKEIIDILSDHGDRAIASLADIIVALDMIQPDEATLAERLDDAMEAIDAAAEDVRAAVRDGITSAHEARAKRH